jgi:hypothetical protein
MHMQLGGEREDFVNAFKGRLNDWARAGNTSHAPKSLPSPSSIVGKALLAWCMYVNQHRDAPWLDNNDDAGIDYCAAMVKQVSIDASMAPLCAQGMVVSCQL